MPHATCPCTTTQLALPGPPPRVTLCFCTACQRRTGSVVGAGAYYARTDLVLPATVPRSRPTDSGRDLTDHACPDCGFVLFWTFAWRPDTVGVSAGSIPGGSAVKPTRIVFCENKPDWFVLPSGVPAFVRGSDGPVWTLPASTEEA